MRTAWSVPRKRRFMLDDITVVGIEKESAEGRRNCLQYSSDARALNAAATRGRATTHASIAT